MKDNKPKIFYDLPISKLFEAGIFFSNSVINAQVPAQINKELQRCAKEFGITPEDVNKALIEIADNQEKAKEAVKLLLTLGETFGFAAEVQDAVEGVGQKQGVVELALLSTMVLGALLVIFTRGRKEEIQKVNIRVEGGKVDIEHENITRYFSPGETVAKILKQALAHILKIPGDQGAGNSR